MFTPPYCDQNGSRFSNEENYSWSQETCFFPQGVLYIKHMRGRTLSVGVFLVYVESFIRMLFGFVDCEGFASLREVHHLWGPAGMCWVLPEEAAAATANSTSTNFVGQNLYSTRQAKLMRLRFAKIKSCFHAQCQIL